jgi:hypothetical protein
MCDICKPILGKYAKLHPRTPCPLEKALYCGQCSVYGHSPKRCSRAVAVPDIVTPYPMGLTAFDRTNICEVTHADGPVRAILLANGITPMVCQEKGKKTQRDFIENKRRLVELAKKRGKGEIIRFIEP